jgi:hypothetical protein
MQIRNWGTGEQEEWDGAVVRMRRSLLPVRALVRLHTMAMHDNTEGIRRIGTHAQGAARCSGLDEERRVRMR